MVASGLIGRSEPRDTRTGRVFVRYPRNKLSRDCNNRADAPTESSLLTSFEAFSLKEAIMPAAGQGHAPRSIRRKPYAAGKHAA